ncbi:glycosyltransferase, partial [Thermofilum sp.]|uniref:glycosyltransferase n=1 Tax=Thermofilum sp. TaxID=1961369 RepID=UPI002589C1CE
MLNILEALLNTGREVTLITSYPYGLKESAKFFEKDIPSVEIRAIKKPNLLKHPYTIAYLAHKTVRSKRDKYDAYIVSDDIPKSVAGSKGISYMHYPHAARFLFREYIATRYKTTLHGSLLWRLHETLFPEFFCVNRKPEKWVLIANSLVTKLHVAKTFQINAENLLLLNPPVASRKINEKLRTSSLEKENLVVYIGRFEIEKRFMEILYALAYLRKKMNIKASLIGFTRDEKLIFETVKQLKLENKIEVLVNANRETLIDRLLKAKVIIHPAPHEPFGIAVVEGMAAGCIPIVKRGVNGPWLEIIEKGKYGLGFNYVEELTNLIENALRMYDSLDVKAIIAKALQYDETIFR